MQQSIILNWINFNYQTQCRNGLQFWTQGAIDCYQRGCNCQGCDLPHPEGGCNMKSAVLDLVKKYGSPEAYIYAQNKKRREEEELINRALEIEKSGKTRKEVAKILGMKYSYLLYLLHRSGNVTYTFFKDKGKKKKRWESTK